MKRKHKVLSWWATILLVLASFLAVGGVTALIMFAMGRFEEEVIWPQDMTFSNEVDGSGFFDPTDQTKLFVASDLKITLTTTTEDVTKSEVRLFLDGDKNKTSNNVLTIPAKCKLNEPFKIELQKTDGWVNGGVTTITAVSEDETLDRKSITVFVDRPAQGIDVGVSQGNGTDVVIGSDFNIETTFNDSDSAKAFAQEDEEKRVFFSATDNLNFDYDWTTGHFHAKTLGEGDVTIYAFANAFFQKQILDAHADVAIDPSALNQAVVQDLRQNYRESERTYWTKTIRVRVKSATVSVVNISNEQQTMHGITDQYFTLTTKSASKFDTLGVTIKEGEGAEYPTLDGLLGNVGIKINKNDKGLLINNTNLNVAGKVVEVVEQKDEEGNITSSAISIKDIEISRSKPFSSWYKEWLDAPEGTEHYLLPSTTSKEAQDYFWRIAAEDTQEHTLYVNFFNSDSNGKLTNFFDFAENKEPWFKFVAQGLQDHLDDAVAWKNQNTIELEISFNENGESEDAQVELYDLHEEVPSANIYKTIRTFLLVNNPNNVAFDVERAFNVKPAVKYEEDYFERQLSIGVQVNNEGYDLYELKSEDVLVATQKVPQNVQVYVLLAIVKTNAENEPTIVRGEDGKDRYQIINLSEPKRVNVDSSLSITKMTPTFRFTGDVAVDEETGMVFVPAINRDSNGANLRMIEFVLKYECEDDNPYTWSGNARKILEAFETTGALRVVCTDAQGVEYDAPYVFLDGVPQEMYGTDEQLSPVGERGQTLYFVGEIAINDQLFASSASGQIVKSAEIALSLEYDNGHTENPFKTQVRGNGDGNSFVVYYQTPAKLEANYMTDERINGSREINISIGQGADGNGEVNMTWGGLTLEDGLTIGGVQYKKDIASVIGILNSNLNFKIVDEHGKYIDTNVSNGLYRITFTDDSGLIVFNDQIQTQIDNFNTTNAHTQTTHMLVEVFENVPGSHAAMSLQFNFTISSLGVSQVDREVVEGDMASNSPQDVGKDEYYEDNQDTSLVTIRRYINPGQDEVDLTSLIRVYLGESKENQVRYTGEIKVQFSDMFLNRISERSGQSKDLAAMLLIDGENIGSEDTMERYRNRNLSKLRITCPFNADTTLEFVVTDMAGTRFYIPLNLVILRQVSITNVFNVYNDQNGYTPFLAKRSEAENDPTPSLFAGDTYKLEEIFRFTNKRVGDYSWQGDWWLVDHTTAGSGQTATLLSISQGELTIGTVDQFQTIYFTIYYGIQSSFALNTGRITVYLNPNFMIVEKQIEDGCSHPFVNLATINKQKIENNFGFYKATSYIDNVISGKGTLTDVETYNAADIDFENVTKLPNGSSQKVINISGISGEAYLFDSSAPELHLYLGQNVSQTFALKKSYNGEIRSINAVLVQEFATAGKQRQIVLCKDNQDAVEIGIEIGFGENEQNAIDNILSREKGRDAGNTASSSGDAGVQIVKMYVSENGQQVLKTFVVLARDTNYKFKSVNYTLKSKTGDITEGSGQTIYTGSTTKYFERENSMTIGVTTTDAKGNYLDGLTLTIRAIISSIGEKFVFYGRAGAYDSGLTATTDKDFNKFKDNEDFWTLISDPASLGAAQKLQAGKTYKIFHALDIKTGKDDENDANGVYGFYYDETLSQAAGGVNAKQKANIKAYRLVNGEQIELNFNDICKIDGDNLTIHHISDEYDDIYIEITLPFKQGVEVFSYKYLIRVVPDFVASSVNYPYAENVEHLDRLAASYVGEGTFEVTEGNSVAGFGRYEINLDETFGATNSKFEDGTLTRFVDPKQAQGVDLKDATIAGTYSVLSAQANGAPVEKLDDNEFFEYDFDTTGKILTITLKQADVELVLVVKKAFTAGTLDVFGCDLEYEFHFNMGTTYTTSVSHKMGEDEATSLDLQDGIYEQTIMAAQNASEFEIDISTGSSGVSTPVTEFDFFIKAKEGELANALQKTYYLKAGTELTSTSDDSKTLTLAERRYFGTFGGEKPKTIELEDGVTYKFDESDCVETYAYMTEKEGQKTIHVKPLENVEHNVIAEIGVYTSERVALKIELTVTGFYEFKVGNGFVGGQTYEFLDIANNNKRAIFTEFVDTSKDGQSIDGIYEEKGADDTTTAKFSYALTIDLDKTDGAKTVKTQNGDIAKSKLVNITNAEDAASWTTGSSIEFAHLMQSVTFRFTATVTRTESSTNAEAESGTADATTSYKFSFDITVGASIAGTNYRYDIGEVYGGVNYLLVLGESSIGEDVFDTIIGLQSKAGLQEAGTSGQYEFVPKSEEDEFGTKAGDPDTSAIIFKPEFVGSRTQGSVEYDIKYTFNSKASDNSEEPDDYYLTFILRLTYTALPSVDVNLNTPAPDGSTLSSMEYLELDNINEDPEGEPRYQKTIENFFVSAPDFAKKNGNAELNRVEFGFVDAIKNKIKTTGEDADQSNKINSPEVNWTITVANIENVALGVTYGSGYENKTSLTITSASPATEKVLLSNELLDGEGGRNIHLTFSLEDSTKNGKVEFAIIVDGVVAKLGDEASNYVVQVLSGGTSAVSILTNPTNYEVGENQLSRETIYAEDLASYQDQAIFKPDRILQFNAKETGTYYFKFTNGNTEKPVKVKIDSANTAINFDAGESLTDFNFVEAYRSYSTENGFEGAYSNDQLFNTIPTITSRLVAVYARDTADEKVIELDDNMNFALGKITGEQSTPQEYLKYDDVKLTKADLNEITQYKVVIVTNFGDIGTEGEEINTISTSGTYNLSLAMDFGVKGVAENATVDKNQTITTNGNLVIDLVAGQDYTLLGDAGEGTLNNQLHIYSTRTNEDYTLETMNASAGNFNLDLYGFSNTPVLEKDGADYQVIQGSEGVQVPQTWDSKEKDLAVTAGLIHKKLQTTEQVLPNGEIIKYSTGLTPRANGFVINTTASDANYYNYLVLDPQNGDYLLKAQGCSNDGNYVMIKVSYSVKVGEEIIADHHNIMFRVVPNNMSGLVSENQSNSSVRFKENFDKDYETVDSNMTYTFDQGQTIANNFKNPYLIKSEDIKPGQNSVYLFNLSGGNEAGTTGFDHSVIDAKLYGNTTNQAATFKYSYTSQTTKESADGETKICNDYSNLLRFTVGWTKEDDTTTTGNEDRNRSSLSFDISAVNLGEKLYFIEFENAFGFKGRFFFKIVATVNPTIKTMAGTTLKEGDKIAVGAEYKNVKITADTEGYYQYTDFTYVSGCDELKFAATPIAVKLVATKEGRIYTKTVEKDLSDKINIFDKSEVWTQTVVEGVEQQSLTDLVGATISLYVKYEKSDGSGEPFEATVTYGKTEGETFTEAKDKDGKVITTSIVCTEDSGFVSPAFDGTDSTYHTVTLSNVMAYGFASKVPVDAATQTAKRSSIDTIKVERIDFYHAGKWIGGSYGKDKADLTDEDDYYKVDESGNVVKVTSANSDDTPFTQTLITNNAKYFAHEKDVEKEGDTGWTQGTSPVKDTYYTVPIKDTYYTVPTIEPREFGNEAVLREVTMNITLISTAGETKNKAILSKQVSIQKETVDLFGTEGKDYDILDGEHPQYDAAVVGDSKKVSSVLNDTLEVTLEDGQSTTFFLHDQALSGVTTEDGNYVASWTVDEASHEVVVNPITIENHSGYTQTYYYSITDNLIDIENRTSNFDGDDDKDFYIYEFNFWEENEDGTPGAAQESGAVFEYNGKASTDVYVNKITQGQPTTNEAGEDTTIYTVDSTTATQIGAYTKDNPTGLRMYIPSVKALSNGDNTMSRTLYFLYLKNGSDGQPKSYQYKQTFKIHPYYDDITGTNLTNGTDIVVNDFVEVSNGSETFYYVPLSGWAGEDGGKLTLTSSVEDAKALLGWTQSETTTPAPTSELPYKFTFESDSSFMDEFGTLTTSTQFKPNSTVTNVKIYMNVSGYDGNFEERNNRLEIGSFPIRLAEGSGKKPHIGDTENLSASGAFKFGAGEGFVYLLEGTLADKTDGYSLGAAIPNTDDGEKVISAGTFACEVDQTVDLGELLGKNANIEAWTNKTYHVLNDGDGDIYCQSNINQRTFNSVGEKEVTVLVTGRGQNSARNGIEYKYQLITFTMHVYGKNLREEHAFAVELSEAGSASFDLSNLDSTTNATWFEVTSDSNNMTQISDSDVSLEKDKGLVQEKTLIMLANSTYKIFRVTFYLYTQDTQETRPVAVPVGSTYNLQTIVSDLVETREGSLYRFREVDDTQHVGEEVSSVKPNNGATKNFLLLTYDANRKVTAVQSVSIKFVIMNATVDKTTGTFASRHSGSEEDEQYVDKSDILAIVKDSLGLKDGTTSNYSDLKLYTRAENGVLTEVEDEIKTKSDLLEVKEFVVTYNTGTTNLVKRVQVRLYYYENESVIDVVVGGLEESSPFSLTKVNAAVLEALKKVNPDVSGAIKYSVLDETNGMLETIVEISELIRKGESEKPDFDGKLYVEIGTHAFLINLKLFVNDVGGILTTTHAGDAESNEDPAKTYVSKTDIERAVKDSLGLEDVADDVKANYSNLQIFLADGETEIGESVEVTEGATSDSFEFVVRYKDADGKQYEKRVVVWLYFYEKANETDDAVALDIPIEDSELQDAPYELKNLDDAVLNAINSALETTGTETELTGDVEWFVQNSNGMLERMVLIPKFVDGADDTVPDFARQFYVQVGDRAFLLNLQISVHKTCWAFAHAGSGEEADKNFADKADIESAVKAKFGLKDAAGDVEANYSDLQIFLADGETEIDESVEVSAAELENGKVFVVKFTSGGTAYTKKLTIKFYLYENAEAINVEVNELKAGEPFELASANESVLAAINAAFEKSDEDKLTGEVKYFLLNALTGELEEVSEIPELVDAEGEGADYEGQFYVQVGEDGQVYLLNLKLSVAAQEEMP